MFYFASWTQVIGFWVSCVFDILLLLPNMVHCRHHHIFIKRGNLALGHNQNSYEMEADGDQGWDLEWNLFSYCIQEGNVTLASFIKKLIFGADWHVWSTV